ncbi:efflux RND transporter periplasmic adaptor subunit [Actinoplanes sp. LDG1-06]|uniref:Efflux RND transporter periplasmic adaptor subunit n=1 Tax=Paractinoplanes ovalisporus TaxID=2810368 RepID=A0ABS2AEN7_9ACTN|nr:efflux RND transporter periplasmic adaptor subunit [Actinoplanes ovalisporus]MBM2618300.1 efflux RND transporter periplasmic adaptor subunit [Actinoplanes ovalisporus]
MDTRRVTGVGAAALLAAVLCGCDSSDESVTTPGLEAHGTVLTTVKPTRQDLSNQISLAGSVTINPVFGIVAPTDGELRYLDKQPSKVPAVRPKWVATVWDSDGAPRRVMIPQGSMLAGRLMDDRADVTAGMPIISAKHSGYGIVAEIDSAQAYRISGAITNVRAQIKNGPGPFACTALGTIAALPAGSIPEPPPPTTEPTTGASGAPPVAQPPTQEDTGGGNEGSEATGMRLVCAPPGGVKLINGAQVTLQVVTAKASKVMVLPVEAVAGVQGKGKVDIVGADQQRKTVDVVLGLTDGKVVQIKSGLKGDETIAVPGPDLPAAEPGAEGDGGKGPNG